MRLEKACGIVTVYKEEDQFLFLLVEQENSKHTWSFPKGHIEENEDLKQTALRELKEETGITDINILDCEMIHEEYEVHDEGDPYFKTNDYFIGFVNDKKVTIQEGEIRSYKWAPYQEALEILHYKERQDVLRKAYECLMNNESHT